MLLDLSFRLCFWAKYDPQVVFEPDAQDNAKTTSHVATCGGNSICIIDVNSGTVLMKYKHKDIKENFYTLAWTTLTLDDEKTNILASGGIRGEIRMFHPQNKVKTGFLENQLFLVVTVVCQVCFHEWRPVDKKNTAVNSLVFHTSQVATLHPAPCSSDPPLPSTSAVQSSLHLCLPAPLPLCTSIPQPTWLFCGTNDGVVSLWDVGTPSLPTYDGVNPKQLLKLFPDYGDVYNIAWSGHQSNWLLAGTAAGLVGWNVEAKKVTEQGAKYRPIMVDFLLPESDKDQGENPIVDSLAVVSEWTIVAKCALHGLIYMWDLKVRLCSVVSPPSQPLSSLSLCLADNNQIID